MHLEVRDNIGMVWGIHVEDFKTKGREPEKVRVRFSATYLYSASDKSWQPLLSHRDIQTFDDAGTYIPNETK